MEEKIEKWCTKYSSRLEELTDRRGEDENVCWLFKGRKSKAGYGLMDVRIPGKRGATTRNAQRLVLLTRRVKAWDVPPELQASHLCGNRLCVRESHLVFERQAINKERQICHNNKECQGHEPQCILTAR